MLTQIEGLLANQTHKINETLGKELVKIDLRFNALEEQITNLDSKIESEVTRLENKIDAVNVKLETEIAKVNLKLETEIAKVNLKLENEITKVNLKIENDVCKRIDVLFDGYKLTHEKQYELERKVDALEQRLERLEAKVG